MDELQALAAANNAEWCDAVCRAHGCETRFAWDAWTTATRSPGFHPDAVTLVPEPSLPDLLGRIDTSPGCSIKDSFASLDVTQNGFRVLFDAEWIVHDRPIAAHIGSAARWEVVRDSASLVPWEQARGQGNPLPTELLDDDSVIVLAGRIDGHVVSGAVLNRSDAIVGLSNFFADAAAVAVSWFGCLEFIRTLVPSLPIVSYASGDELAVARRHGFERIGPLRVWVIEG